MMEQSSEFAFMALKGSGSVYGNIGGGNWNITQLTFACSKSTIETEKGEKYVQS